MLPLKTIRALSILLFLFGANAKPARAQESATPGAGQFAYLHTMTPAADASFTIEVDYAEILTGDAARRAAEEDGRPAPKSGGRYIENRTKTLRTLTVPAWAQVYLLQQGQPTLVRPAVLHTLLQGEKSPFGAFFGFPYRCEGDAPNCLPVRITQRDGQVLRIDQVVGR